MFEIKANMPMYDPESVKPMREELTDVGFIELKEQADIDKVLDTNDDKTTLVLINSVCGCAAGSARPGATLALQNNVIPDRYATAFAGQDKPAVQYIREKYLSEFPPSSPSMALIKNGKVEFFLPRLEIEGRTAQQISQILIKVFEEKCTCEGPSISKEEYENLVYKRTCGSNIPRM